MPMGQYRISKQVQDHFKPVYEKIYQKNPTTFSGFSFECIPRPMMHDSEEEREATWRGRDLGAFHFWRSDISTATQSSLSIIVGNYQDLFFDKDTNDAAYAFWRKMVGEMVKVPKKRELLAPAVPPHPFGCKRPSLGQYFYDTFNQDNVDLVDVSANLILEITPKGVRTTEKEHKFDVRIPTNL